MGTKGYKEHQLHLVTVTSKANTIMRMACISLNVQQYKHKQITKD